MIECVLVHNTSDTWVITTSLKLITGHRKRDTMNSRSSLLRVFLLLPLSWILEGKDFFSFSFLWSLLFLLFLRGNIRPCLSSVAPLSFLLNFFLCLCLLWAKYWTVFCRIFFSCLSFSFFFKIWFIIYFDHKTLKSKFIVSTLISKRCFIFCPSLNSLCNVWQCVFSKVWATHKHL